MAGPNLSPETIRRVEILFRPEDRETAIALLRDQCGDNLAFGKNADMYTLERPRLAALKLSDGNLPGLERAVRLAQGDWRDLLVAAGFANDSGAHRKWEPKPYTEPSLIDAPQLAEGIHARLAAVLDPLGFVRNGEEWLRDTEVPQCVRLQTGLRSRIEVKFFLRVTLEAKPTGVLVHLPKLASGAKAFTGEQGYIFRAGDSDAPLYERVISDFETFARPWLERFTTIEEFRLGLEERVFARSLPSKEYFIVF